MQPPELEYMFSYTTDIEEPQQGVGSGPFGYRLIAKVTGGRIEGPMLTGEVLPGGGDWALIDATNTLRLDARITLKTDDEALIFASYKALSRRSIPRPSRRRMQERWSWANSIIARQ